MTQSQESNTIRARPRWWPALVFLGLAAVAILWVQFFWDVHQQDKNIWTYLLCGVCFFCLLLWLLVLSNLPWRTRWMALGAVVAVHLLVFATIRIKGVNGNLVPILQWRWEEIAFQPNSSSSPVSPQQINSADESIVGSWPQFLGPDRDGVVALDQLQTNWIVHPPVELWRVPVGPGWSGFAVSGGRAVTQEQQGMNEAVTCFDASNGQRLWSHPYEARYATTIAGEGPRATPSIAQGRVYAVGGTGWLTCLDLESGRLLWAQNVIEQNGGAVPEWGFSVSPLVVDDLVIVSAGGTEGRSLVALDPLTGEPRWAGGTDEASYSSPVLREIGGRSQVLVFNKASVAGHDVRTGRLLWHLPYSKAEVHVAAPLAVAENRVLFSSGYGHGSELYSVQENDQGDWSAELVWKSRRMKAKFTNLILHEGFIYGLDDGILACIAAATGELQWKDGRYGHGQMLLVGEYLLVSTERGELVLIRPSLEGRAELARVRVFEGKTWNPPALAGRQLFLRTDREAACLELP